MTYLIWFSWVWSMLKGVFTQCQIKWVHIVHRYTVDEYKVFAYMLPLSKYNAFLKEWKFRNGALILLPIQFFIS